MKLLKMFSKKWFVEDFLPGEQSSALEAFAVEKVVYEGKSKYQEIAITENKLAGRILYLDNLQQVATNFEHVYHEMLVHPALLALQNPGRVCVIGGGDGGALREVLKHPVKEAVLAEIDKNVMDVSAKYLASVSQGAFTDKRTHVVLGDAVETLKRYKGYFDCIIMDSSDPHESIAQALWSPFFMKAVKRSLKKGGAFEMQAGYLMEHFGRRQAKTLERIYNNVEKLRAFVQSFPLDEHLFLVASDGLLKVSVSTLEKRMKQRKIKAKYYSPAMQQAASIFPPTFL